SFHECGRPSAGRVAKRSGRSVARLRARRLRTGVRRRDRSPGLLAERSRFGVARGGAGAAEVRTPRVRLVFLSFFGRAVAETLPVNRVEWVTEQGWVSGHRLR